MVKQSVLSICRCRHRGCCHLSYDFFEKIFQTGDLEAITIAKQQVTTEIAKISTCLHLIVTTTILVFVCPALFYSTSVRSAILIRSRIECDRGRAYLLTRIHTGVYVEKCTCHYYGDQPCLQLVYEHGFKVYTLFPVCSVQEGEVCLCYRLLIFYQ